MKRRGGDITVISVELVSIPFHKLCSEKRQFEIDEKRQYNNELVLNFNIVSDFGFQYANFYYG